MEGNILLWDILLITERVAGLVVTGLSEYRDIFTACNEDDTTVLHFYFALASD